MTGHQPTPSTEQTTDGKPLRNVDIANLLRGLGVTWVKTVNPFQPDKVEAVIKAGLKKPGFKAIVAEGECALQSARRNSVVGVKPKVTYYIDTEKCTMCDICFVDLGCPAIVVHQAEDGSDIYAIDPGLCTRCGACISVCPTSAIVTREGWRENDKAV